MAGKVSEYGLHGRIVFERLWGLLEERGLNKQYLLNHGFHKGTVYKLWRNENVDCRTIVDLCALLDVQPKDFMDFKR